MTTPARELTRREVFAHEYLKDMNGGKAAVRAGYSPNGAKQTAYKLLKLPEVKAIVDAGKLERVAQAKVSKDWLVDRTVELANRAKKKGALTAERGALELLGRLHGYVTENRNMRVIRGLKDLSQEELEALASEEPQRQ